MKTILETCQALLDNPIEVVDKKHPNYEYHRGNFKMLVYKEIIPFHNNEYLFDKENIETFIKNNGLTPSEKLELDRDFREKETLKLAEKSNKYAKISLLISILAFIFSVIPLFRSLLTQVWK